MLALLFANSITTHHVTHFTFLCVYFLCFSISVIITFAGVPAKARLGTI